MGEFRRIKYRLAIDQQALFNAGIMGIDYIDIAIYEFIAGMMRVRNTNKKMIGNNVFVRVDTDTIIEQMPYLSRKGRLSKDAVCDRISNLVSVGMLERHPDNRTTGSAFYSVGEICDSLEQGEVDDMSNTQDTTLGEFTQAPTVNSPMPLRRIHPSPLGEFTQENYIELTDKTNLGEKVEEAPLPKQKTTLDYPECIGFGASIKYDEYPRQEHGSPFPHPEVIEGKIDRSKWFDLWWQLYDLNQDRMKCEMEFVQQGFTTIEQFKSLYHHTYLFVAITPKEFRRSPWRYLQAKQYLNEIVDRRPKPKDLNHGARPSTWGFSTDTNSDTPIQ